MADGGFSIEQMKVVIDSETEKFSAGISKCKGLIDQFAGAAGTELPKVDKAMMATGNAVEALRTKMGVFLRLAEYALEIGEKAMKMASQAANSIGKDEEFQQVKESVDDLGSAISEGLGKAFSGTKAEMAEYAAGLTGMKQTTGKVGEEAQAASSRIGVTLSDAINRVATATKNFKIASYDVQGLKDAVDGLTQAFKGIGGGGEMWDLKDWNKELVLLEQQLDSARKTKERYDEIADKKPSGELRYADILYAQVHLKDAAEKLQIYTDKVQAAKDKIEELSKVKDPTDFVDSGELDRQTAAIERQNETMAISIITMRMAAAEAAGFKLEYNAVKASMEKDGGMSAESADNLLEAIKRRKELIDMEKEQRDIVAADKAAVTFDDKLEREIKGLHDKTVALMMGDEAAAAYLSRQKLLDEAAQKNLTLTDAQVHKIDELAAAQQRLKDRQDDKHQDDQEAVATDTAIRRIEREVGAIKAKAAEIGLTAGAAARLSAEQRALTDLESKGILVSDELRASISAYGAEIEQATTKLREQQKMLDNIRETGRVVTSGLESAFRNWTNGAKLDVKEMVRSMIADMALLVFRKNVTDQLGNLFTSGVGSMLGIGGMRESGGPVAAGVPYVVGEKRAELFIPESNGYVLPSVPQPNVSNTSNNSRSMTYAPQITVDARGATPDAVRMLEARLPQIISTHYAEMRERGAM